MNKILLSTAAVIVYGVSSLPSSANIELSIGGEVSLIAGMNECGVAAPSSLGIEAAIEEISGDSLIDNSDVGVGNSTDALFDDINTYLTGTIGHSAAAITAAQETGGAASAYSFIADPCNGADRSGIDWDFGKELSISASGTLANGLEVSFSDTLDLTDTNAETGAFELVLGTAVGTLTFKDGAASAVDAAMVTGKKNLDVNGNNLGAHKTETDGSAGMGILWNAPSVGNLDLYVGWAPNSGGDGLDDANYENTFSIGAVMTAGDIEIGAGYEAASANDACDALDASSFASGTMIALADHVYGGDYCGDQTLMYIGATMSAADIGFSAGYSIFDTDEADLTVMSIGASTSMGAYDVAIDYRTNSKEYEFGNKEDNQSVIAVELGTSLGDGVDLALVLSANDIDLLAERNNAADANGKNNLYLAEVSLAVGF